MNKIIKIQSRVKLYTSIFIGFTAIITMISCVFPAFCKKLHNFEHLTIFTQHLVFLCQYISSKNLENVKQKYLFLAEVLSFRYGIVFYLRTLYCSLITLFEHCLQIVCVIISQIHFFLLSSLAMHSEFRIMTYLNCSKDFLWSTMYQVESGLVAIIGRLELNSCKECSMP